MYLTHLTFMVSLALPYCKMPLNRDHSATVVSRPEFRLRPVPGENCAFRLAVLYASPFDCATAPFAVMPKLRALPRSLLMPNPAPACHEEADCEDDPLDTALSMVRSRLVEPVPSLRLRAL